LPDATYCKYNFKAMKNFFNYLNPLIYVLSIFIFAASCGPEIEPDPITPGAPNNPNTPDNPGSAGPIDPNEASDYLVLSDAVKIPGNLPPALGNQLKINFKDTLYVIKDHPYKARISVMHDTTTNVTGFYIAAHGASHYFDVPAVAEESKDSIDVIYLGLSPEEEKVTFPYTLEITIQPHDQNGTSLGTFQKFITIEDPDDPDKCEIYNTFDAWKWMYTEMYLYSGEFFKLTAPMFSATYHSTGTSGGYQYGLCCINDPDFGLITAYPGDPTREGICNDKNPLYKGVFIDGAYSLNSYDYLFIFSSGNFIHYSGTLTSNFVPQKSRICDLFAYYELLLTEYVKTGIHDYVPGSNKIRFTTQISNPSFGPAPPFGEFVSTCHLLVFTINIEEKFKIVYQRYPDLNKDNNIPDPMDHLHQWFEF
jgi:hypothetical protein